jgi:hypothetical protein
MEKRIAAILGVAIFAASVSPACADWRGRTEEWQRGGGDWRHGGDERLEHRQYFNGGSGTGFGGAGSGLGRGLPFVSPPPIYGRPPASPSFNYGPRCGFPYC